MSCVYLAIDPNTKSLFFFVDIGDHIILYVSSKLQNIQPPINFTIPYLTIPCDSDRKHVISAIQSHYLLEPIREE